MLFAGFCTIGGEKGMAFAMAKSQYLQTMLVEHPYDFLNPYSMQGRKIWYKGLPATIKVNDSEPWRIGIVPDYSFITKDDWWGSLDIQEQNVPFLRIKTEMEIDDEETDREYRTEGKLTDYINHGEALSDSHINWFRK